MLKKLEDWYESLAGRMTLLVVGAILVAIAYARLYFRSRLDRHFDSAIFWSCIAIFWFFRIRRERNANKNKEPDGGCDPESDGGG